MDYEKTQVQQQDINQDINFDEETKSLETSLFKHIDPKEEFGISRFITDPVYYIPQLVRNFILQPMAQNIYLIRSEIKNSYGDSIKLEHRFKCLNPLDAEALTQTFINNITSRQMKVWLACWKMANIVGRKTFTNKLTDIMKIAYPNRTAYFSTKEKEIFYQDLLDLESTTFIISKKIKEPKKKKPTLTSYRVPLISIKQQAESILKSSSSKYPHKISISVLDDLGKTKEKLYYMGTSIKNKTLELHSNDIQLAKVVQIRKSQMAESKFIAFDREFLITVCGLEQTNQTNRRQANKILLEKLKRLKEMDVILDYPQRITTSIKLQIR